MNRTSRVPYHQNVSDLLLIEPGESQEVARLVAEAEQRIGRRFPAALRELYAALGNADPFGCYDYPYSVEMIVRSWIVRAPRRFTLDLGGFKGEHASDSVALDGSDDPPVVSILVDSTVEVSPQFVAVRYTDHVFEQAVGYWHDTRDGSQYWLRTPSEPFAVPVLDFLTEQLGEPQRTPRDGDVTTYTWRPEGGTIRVTADHPAHPEPLSAWWVHADAPERLAEFALLLLPWGTLRDTLRADTDPAREVLDRVRAN